jgi:hypothetical protein
MIRVQVPRPVETTRPLLRSDVGWSVRREAENQVFNMVVPFAVGMDFVKTPSEGTCETNAVYAGDNEESSSPSSTELGWRFHEASRSFYSGSWAA